MLDAALESLSEQECLTLLKSVKYGRVAVVTNQGRPEISPSTTGCTTEPSSLLPAPRPPSLGAPRPGLRSKWTSSTRGATRVRRAPS